MAPARKPRHEVAPVPAAGGFGAPFFEFDGVRRRVRVERGELVHDCNGRERRAPPRRLAAAGAAIHRAAPLRGWS